MDVLQDIDGLSECIGRAIQDHLAKSNINIAWPQIDRLDHPVLRVEAILEDASPATAKRRKKKPERIALVRDPHFYVVGITLQLGRLRWDNRLLLIPHGRWEYPEFGTRCLRVACCVAVNHQRHAVCLEPKH
jgi:hypothetical protein